MNLKKKTSIYLILLLFQVACNDSSNQSTFNKTFFEKSEQEWLSTTSSMGYKGTELRNHVLLIIHTTECAPCKQEIDWWNEEGINQVKADLSLIIIERHNSVFNAFLEAESLNIPAFQDSSALLFEQKLIPTTPVKIYFNRNGNISAIDQIGMGGDLEVFLKKIRASKKMRDKRSTKL